jgi:sterol-4alpha-carboxylate 3-dehydrogenase (decarboxylating)
VWRACGAHSLSLCVCGLGGDESLPYCTTHLDGYTETKEKAERIVLEANGRKGLLTVALRPSGIFGPGDVQGWPGFIDAARNGKSKFQLVRASLPSNATS